MQPETPVSQSPRRVLVVADRDFPDAHDPDAHRLADAVDGSHVLVVAPAGPIAGERWIIDLTARETRARERLETWTEALAAHARTVEGEIGHERTDCAESEARRVFSPDVVLTATTPSPRTPRSISGLSARSRSGRGAVARQLQVNRRALAQH